MTPTFVYVPENVLFARGPGNEEPMKWFPGIVTSVSESVATVCLIDPAPMAQSFKEDVDVRHLVDAQKWFLADPDEDRPRDTRFLAIHTYGERDGYDAVMYR